LQHSSSKILKNMSPAQMKKFWPQHPKLSYIQHTAML
jgi:hypothetical protein